VFELGLENCWDGFMLGMTEIIVSIPIYNQVSLLSLTGDSIPVIFSVGGMLLSLNVKYVILLHMYVAYICTYVHSYVSTAI